MNNLHTVLAQVTVCNMCSSRLWFENLSVDLIFIIVLLFPLYLDLAAGFSLAPLHYIHCFPLFLCGLYLVPACCSRLFWLFKKQAIIVFYTKSSHAFLMVWNCFGILVWTYFARQRSCGYRGVRVTVSYWQQICLTLIYSQELRARSEGWNSVTSSRTES